MLKNLLKGSAASLAIILGSAQVQAAPTTALYLTMDGSGSITGADFTTQISGYVSALNAFFAGNPGAFGLVAIGGNIFGSNNAEFFPLTTITDAAALASLTTAIGGLDPGRGGIATGGTAIGDAVAAAASALLAFEVAQLVDLKLLVDVTTDGVNNTGSDPTTAASNAIVAGLDAVNCLGLGGAADCSFVAGSGTDFGTVSFAALSLALERKIEIEVIGVPEPMSLALFGLGLVGLGILGRRSAA